MLETPPGLPRTLRGGFGLPPPVHASDLSGTLGHGVATLGCFAKSGIYAEQRGWVAYGPRRHSGLYFGNDPSAYQPYAPSIGVDHIRRQFSAEVEQQRDFQAQQLAALHAEAQRLRSQNVQLERELGARDQAQRPHVTNGMPSVRAAGTVKIVMPPFDGREV
ncbi:hypothetical protein ATCC90586_008608 [Pythium insidiosum]|nr:hypothetical protein ATCC90586_008608 [Pythium insidiosum]